MKKELLHISIFLLVLLQFSCEKETKWDFKTEPINKIVVDGIITNEKIRHEIRVTKPHQVINAEPNNVTGASVFINDGSDTDKLTEIPYGSGIYLTDSFRAVYGKEYKLIVVYNADTFIAKASMVPITPFIKATYSLKDTLRGLLGIDWVGRSYNSNEPAMWQLYLDWSEVPGYQNLHPDSTHAKLVHYTLPTIDVNQIFAPDKQEVLFPPGTKIVQRKYALSDEHAEFIRSLLAETEWRGGFFDVAPANVVSNVSNGGMGYFGACIIKTKEFTAD